MRPRFTSPSMTAIGLRPGSVITLAWRVGHGKKSEEPSPAGDHTGIGLYPMKGKPRTWSTRSCAFRARKHKAKAIQHWRVSNKSARASLSRKALFDSLDFPEPERHGLRKRYLIDGLERVVLRRVSRYTQTCPMIQAHSQ